MQVQEHVFTARGAALEAMNSRAPEICLEGPAGTGKSRAVLEKANLMCLLTPNTKGLFLRKVARSLATSAIKTWERDVIPDATRDCSIRYYGGSAREPAQYRYANGSSIAIGGLDDPMKIMSTEYDWIYIQEATEVTSEDVQACTVRLRNGNLSFQQLMMDCNPGDPGHHLLARAEEGKLQMLHSRHEDNPRYFNDDGTMTEEGRTYIGRLDSLTGVMYLRLRRGLWVGAEGVIFDGFDPALHVIDRPTIPESWERIWAIDFGYTNPFVWQDWAIDEDGRGYLVREIYMSGRLVEDHARQIRGLCGLGELDRHGRTQRYEGPRRAAWERKLPSAIVCDHDAEDRATFERHSGFGTVPAEKAVVDGIEAMAGRLRLAGDGKPRLFFCNEALVEPDETLKLMKKPWKTVMEIPSYRWAEEPPAQDRKARQPVKRNDHGCDTTRYFVCEIDLHGKTNVRWA